METQNQSPRLPVERAQNKAARWVLWGYVIMSSAGVFLHTILHWADRSAVDWMYLLPMAGIGIAALFSIRCLPHSLSKAMFTFAWSALACVTLLLVYQIGGNGNYQAIVPMFHIGIFSIGLILGFIPAIKYATAATAIIVLTSLIYDFGIGNTILYAVLAYASALPAKIVEQLIEQSTAELSAINLRLESLVEARTAELRDEIAVRKKAETALRQRGLELEKRNEDLDAYAHTVAHDLKSPLATLVGFTELLEHHHSEMAPDKLPHLFHIMSVSGRKIINITDELLLLASVRVIDDVQVACIDMARITAESRKRLSDAIEKSEAELIVPETWPAAIGYAPWIEEVVVNYISNAIKYGGTPPRIHLGATPLHNGYVRFWVRDNGDGLTPEQQTQIFAPFTQFTNLRANGHGLGLSIVQRIMDKLNGEVGVESETGQGSTFYFTLPCTADSGSPEDNG